MGITMTRLAIIPHCTGLRRAQMQAIATDGVIYVISLLVLVRETCKTAELIGMFEGKLAWAQESNHADGLWGGVWISQWKGGLFS